MAVKISVDSLVTYGAAGSPFGSEIIINISPGPNYITRTSVNLLARVLPAWLQLVDGLAGPGGFDVQYTPDAGTTWRSAKMGTSTLIYADTGGSWRIFGTHAAGTLNVFCVPIRQAS